MQLNSLCKYAADGLQYCTAVQLIFHVWVSLSASLDCLTDALSYRLLAPRLPHNWRISYSGVKCVLLLKAVVLWNFCRIWKFDSRFRFQAQRPPMTAMTHIVLVFLCATILLTLLAPGRALSRCLLSGWIEHLNTKVYWCEISTGFL